mgnify:CR=1 FL=1
MGKSRRGQSTKPKTKTVKISKKPQSLFQSFTRKQKAQLKSVGLFKDIPRDITFEQLIILKEKLTKKRDKEIASDRYAAEELKDRPIYTRENKDDLDKINALKNILSNAGKTKKRKRKKKKQTKRKK